MGRTFSIASVFAVLCSTSAFGADASKLELGVKKGHTAEFTVQRASKVKGGSFEWGSTSEITYRLEVTDEKENGDLVLGVTYASVKIKRDGRDGAWTFDSANKAESSGDEVADLIRDAISSKISVVLSKGTVSEVSGFPKLEEAGDDEDRRKRRRRGQALRVAGERILKTDLGHFLTSAVQGHALEKGKTYTVARKKEKDTASGGDGRRRGRGRWRSPDSRLVYTFESQAKEGESDSAKFLLKQAPRDEPRESDRPAPESKGEAFVSLQDGLLLKLDFTSSAEWKRGDRAGTWNTMLKITRAQSDAEKAKKKRKAVDV